MSPLALIKDDRYLEHDAGEGHPESPDRLRVVHALVNKEFNDLPLIPPRLATEDEIASVHDPFYIQMVAKTAGRLRSQLDADTGLSARSYEIARLAAGGLLQAVDTLLGNSPHLNPLPGGARTTNNLSISSGERTSNTHPLPSGERAGVRGGSKLTTPNSAFAFIRPPGHHAEPDRGMGFCIFNNIAIAAAYAKERYGLKRILIVDWDLHHGNGTQHAFYDDPAVLYFSSHQFPYYPGTGNYNEVGSGAGEGFTVNAPFPHGFGDREYLDVYNSVLVPIALEYRPELVLVSAGFDPYVKDPLGGMGVTGDGFGGLAGIIRGIAEKTCEGKVLIALEGGYHPDGLQEGVRAVLNAFIGQAKPVQPASSPAADEVIRNIIANQKQYWKSLK